jgi:hypothetical protein
MNTDPELRMVFAWFKDDHILDEMGRLLHSILNIFTTNGYEVRLYNNINFSALDKYGQLVPSMNKLTLVDKIPDDFAHMLYLFDREDRSCADLQWKKKVQVKFDMFSRYWITDPVFMPYPVHPLLSGADLPQRLEKLRRNKKRLRIFFSGDIKGYTKNRIHYPNTKLPRLDVINTILDKLSAKTIHVKDASSLSQLLDGDFINRCIIVDTSKFFVDPTDWLPDLSKADFFICPPGYAMPMCHNVIEAMAVGTIPIISYPEWFNPDLRHMKNCIVFGDKDDLVKKINDVLDMGKQQVAEMRQKVIDYYENHLNPQKFVDDIETKKGNRVTVLMITDKNTIKNASQLSKRSILITGKPVLAGTPLYKFFSRF